MRSVDAGSRIMNARYRRKRALLLFLLLAGAAIALARISEWLPGARTAQGGKQSEASSGSTPSTAQIHVNWPMEIRRDIFADAKPTPEAAPRIIVPLPDTIRQEAATSLVLKAIIVNGPPRAIINDTIYAEGESVNGFRIVRIEARRVLLEKKSVSVELKL